MVAEAVLDVLKSVIVGDDFVALHEPCLSGNEQANVKDCLDTGWVSSAGQYVNKFEEMLAEYTGVKKAVAVVNGTSALHICLKLTGVELGDEVLIPDLTFVATANAVSYCGAIPHFVDIEEKTLGLDSKKMEDYLKEIIEVRSGQSFNKNTGRRIKAVIPMHTFGHPVDLDPLAELCRKYKLTMIEDAAESLGSFYKKRHTGNWGRLSALSFNGNKIVTTGGGGAILTNDERLGLHVKHITSTAKVPHKWDYYHDQVGYNFRMPNINAALGCAQMEQLPDFIRKKRALAEKYRQAFINFDGVYFFTEPEYAQSNYWLNVLILDKEIAIQRNKILEITNANGYMTRPAWILMHELPMYKDCPRMDVSVAENLASRLINIPSSAFL